MWASPTFQNSLTNIHTPAFALAVCLQLQNHLLKTTSFLMPHHESLFFCHPLPILSQHPGLLSSHRATYGSTESLATCPRDAATDGWSPSSFPILPTVYTFHLSKTERWVCCKFPWSGLTCRSVRKKGCSKTSPSIKPVHQHPFHHHNGNATY